MSEKQKLEFKPTHRMLVVANATGHTYNTITIDVNSGLYKKTDVKADETKIRAKEGIHGERLCYNGGGDYNQVLSDKELLKIGNEFNKVRAKQDWDELPFYRVESAYAKSLEIS